jgi:hypothetical protein
MCVLAEPERAPSWSPSFVVWLLPDLARGQETSRDDVKEGEG